MDELGVLISMSAICWSYPSQIEGSSFEKSSLRDSWIGLWHFEPLGSKMMNLGVRWRFQCEKVMPWLIV